jgi:hypothetical protein
VRSKRLGTRAGPQSHRMRCFLDTTCFGVGLPARQDASGPGVPSILPGMTFDEPHILTKIYPVSGLLPGDTLLIRHRPFAYPTIPSTTLGWWKAGEIPILVSSPRPTGGALSGRVSQMLRQIPGDTLPAAGGQEAQHRPKLGLAHLPLQLRDDRCDEPMPMRHHGDPVKESVCMFGAIGHCQQRFSAPLLDRSDTRSASRSRASSTTSSRTRAWTSRRPAPAIRVALP